MEMNGILPLTDRLNVEVYQLLEEHKESVTLLDELANSAAKEKKARYARLAEKLKAHTLNEEEVLYPASLFIGKYVHERVELHDASIIPEVVAERTLAAIPEETRQASGGRRSLPENDWEGYIVALNSHQSPSSICHCLVTQQ
jgi:hypothetical protein